MRPNNESFRDTFWSPYTCSEPFTNYAIGLHVLHDKLGKSVLENKAIIQYLQKRIDAEIACAQLLETNLSPVISEASSDILNAMVKSSFDIICQEGMDTAHNYRVRAGALAQDVLEPLENFARLFENELNSKKSQLDEKIQDFEHAAQAALMTRSVYWYRCRALELACPDFRPPAPAEFQDEEDNEDDNEEDFIGGRQRRSSSVTSELNVDRGGVRLGKGTVLPYRQVANMINRMQRMIESTSKTSPRKYLGKHIFEWIRDNCATPHEDVSLDSETEEICQHLVALRFLKSCSKDKGKFDVEQYYEVQQNIVDRYLRKMRIRNNMPREQPDAVDESVELALQVPSTIALESNGSTSFLNGLFGKLKPQKKPSVGLASKVHEEMVEADEAYKKKVKQADQSRKRLEESMMTHLDEMQQLEMSRINIIKHAFTAMSKSLSDSLPIMEKTYQQIALFQETIEPEQAISYVIEQFKTGPCCPKPMVYENYYYGSATDQIFGVPLEEVAQAYGSYVPPIISRGIKYIDKAIALKPTAEKNKMAEEIWSAVLPMQELNVLCDQVDNLAGPRLRKSLEQYEPRVLANLIRMYLLELPECLLTFDLYEPVKLLYATQQDTESRLVSVSKLLATLPSPNYYTAKELSCHLSRLLKLTKNDGLLSHLVSSFAYILMRPRVVSSLNIHDRHPKKLIRDLFTRYDTIFTQDVSKVQMSGASRATIIANEPLEISASPWNKNDSSESALRRTLMHIIRPNTTEIEIRSRQHASNGLPFVTHPKTTILDDPDNSSPSLHHSSTPSRNSVEKTHWQTLDDIDRVDTKRLSADVSLMLDPEEDERDAVEIEEVYHHPISVRKPNRSRASTQGTMDNVTLDPFFSED